MICGDGMILFAPGTMLDRKLSCFVLNFRRHCGMLSLGLGVVRSTILNTRFPCRVPTSNTASLAEKIMKRHPPITCICQYCGKTYTIPFWELKRGGGKFCSRKCAARSPSHRAAVAAAHRGVTPTNAKLQIPVTCITCGKEFRVPQRRAETVRFCSRACSHEAKRRISGTDHPLFRRVKMFCEWCGKAKWVKRAKVHEFRFCSRHCVGSYTSAKMAKNCGATSIEQALMDELARRQLFFRSQHQIASWLVDVSLPQYRIAIEADGDYWHQSASQKQKDANKTHWLEAHKWTVFRFTGTEINESVSHCIDLVAEHIAKTTLTQKQLHLL